MKSTFWKLRPPVAVRGIPTDDVQPTKKRDPQVDHRMTKKFEALRSSLKIENDDKAIRKQRQAELTSEQAQAALDAYDPTTPLPQLSARAKAILHREPIE